MSKLNKRKRVQIFFKEPTLTKQSFKDECDINKIIKRFSETGQIPLQNGLEAQYGEAPIMDLKLALDTVDNLRQEFDNLEPQQKEIFGGNMNNYAQFLSDYAESPQSFAIEPKSKTDTSVQDVTKVAEKTALDSSDGGGQSET